jgi:hypothetical protein
VSLIAGTNMNQFLNENYKDVLKDIGPGLAKTFADLMKRILTNISDQFPYDVVYPK